MPLTPNPNSDSNPGLTPDSKQNTYSNPGLAPDSKQNLDSNPGLAPDALRNPDATLGELRGAIRETLAPKYGEREATAMARVILTTLKGWELPLLLANEQRTAGQALTARCADIVGQLLRDVPLQYALGQTTFYGLKLKVGPGVLIPRPETEELVDLIVKENPQPDLRVLDLCTGSGAIAVALARNLPFSKVTAVDVSPSALSYARENTATLKTSVELKEADIFSLSLPPEEFDIIVSNPPYVCESEKSGMEPNVLSHEPSLALFVPDDDPLRFYRRIATMAADALKSGGRLYFEINPLHATELRSMLEAEGFGEVELIKDVHGKQRFAKAVKR